MDVNLINQLHRLGIDLCGVTESSIATWNNKHMPDTEEFFNWFTRYLNESNVLEPSESEEYSGLVAENLLNDKEYDQTFIDLEKKHNGIFDVELNKSKIFILESEYKALQMYEQELESEIEANMAISKHIEKEIRKATKKSDILVVKYENVYDFCVGRGKKLDIAFSDLRLKVLDCLACWNEDWSIFSTGDEKIKQKYKDGVENVSSFCNNLVDSITFDLEQDNDADVVNLEKRLNDAVLYSYVAKVKAKQLEAEITFYKNLDSLEVDLINPEDQWCIIQTESLELANQVNAEGSLGLLQELSLEYVKNHLDKLSIIKTEKAVLEAKKKLENLCKINNTVIDILVYNDTHLSLLKIINDNLNALDTFLREELPSIVNIDLRSCRDRTELMKERIQEHKDNQQKPIEQQNKLIRIIVDLISSEHIEIITPEIFKNLSNQFYGTILDYERKLFFNDIEIYRSKISVLEKNNYFIKEHLKSRSCNEIVLCPIDYSSALFKLREASKEAEDIVAKVLQCRKSTDSTLKGNKWLRIKRQLWMYFLVNPRKVIEYLNEIIAENTQKITTQFKDDNDIFNNAHKHLNP